MPEFSVNDNTVQQAPLSFFECVQQVRDLRPLEKPPSPAALVSELFADLSIFHTMMRGKQYGTQRFRLVDLAFRCVLYLDRPLEDCFYELGRVPRPDPRAPAYIDGLAGRLFPQLVAALGRIGHYCESYDPDKLHEVILVFVATCRQTAEQLSLVTLEPARSPSPPVWSSLPDAADQQPVASAYTAEGEPVT